MKKWWPLIGSFLLASFQTATATLVVANPQSDGYSDGYDLSAAYPSLTLSALWGASTGPVYGAESPFSSEIVFGYDEGFGPSPSWQFANALRGDFLTAVDFVQVTFFSDVFGSVNLTAFDEFGNVLGSDSASPTSYDPIVLSVSNPNIAYFLADVSGFADRGEIAEIQYNIVPEPGVGVLLAVGVAALGARLRARRVS